MPDPRFRLVSSVIVLGLIGAIIWPAADGGLGSYGAFQFTLFFGGFFLWQAVAAAWQLFCKPKG